MTELVIKAAMPADARAIAALRTAVAQGMTRQYGEGHWSALPSRSEVLKQMRASQMLVAWQGEHIVGTVRLATVNPHLIDANGFTRVDSALYVLGMAVAPECRRMGVGRKLVEEVKDVARSRRVQALWLDAYENLAGAGPFYLRCGFRRVGSSGKAGFQGTIPLVFYELLLD